MRLAHDGHAYHDDGTRWETPAALTQETTTMTTTNRPTVMKLGYIEHERTVTIHVTDGPIGRTWDGPDVRLTRIIGHYADPTPVDPDPYFEVVLKGDGLLKNGTARKGYGNRYWSDRPDGRPTETEESVRAEADALVRKELGI